MLHYLFDGSSNHHYTLLYLILQDSFKSSWKHSDLVQFIHESGKTSELSALTNKWYQTSESEKIPQNTTLSLTTTSESKVGFEIFEYFVTCREIFKYAPETNQYCSEKNHNKCISFISYLYSLFRYSTFLLLYIVLPLTICVLCTFIRSLFFIGPKFLFVVILGFCLPRLFYKTGSSTYLSYLWL